MSVAPTFACASVDATCCWKSLSKPCGVSTPAMVSTLGAAGVPDSPASPLAVVASANANSPLARALIDNQRFFMDCSLLLPT